MNTRCNNSRVSTTTSPPQLNEYQVQQFKSVYDHLSPQLNEHQVQQFKSFYDHLSPQLNEHEVQQFKSVYDHLSPQLNEHQVQQFKSAMLTLQKRKVPLLGCLFCHWMIMAFTSTGELSRMQYACILAGSCQIP